MAVIVRTSIIIVYLLYHELIVLFKGSVKLDKGVYA